MEFFVRIQSDKNHAMFVYASLQIDLVLNKLIMALAEKLTHENAGASISRGVIVSRRHLLTALKSKFSSDISASRLFH